MQPYFTCVPHWMQIRELQAAKDRIIVLEEILNEKNLMIGELHNQIKVINSAANGKCYKIGLPWERDRGLGIFGGLESSWLLNISCLCYYFLVLILSFAGVSGSGSTASCPLSPQQITNLSTKTKPKTLPPTSPPQSVKLHNDIAVYNELLVTPLDPDQFGDIMFPAAALTNAKSQKLKHLNSLTIHAQESRDGSADASGSDVSRPETCALNH